MRARLPLALTLVLLAAAPAWAATITHGPYLGAVMPGSAEVLVRTSEPAEVIAETSLAGDFSDAVASAPVLTSGPSSSDDLTAKLKLLNLPDDALITYRIRVDGAVVIPLKQFHAFPILSETPFTICFYADFEKSDDWPGLIVGLAQGCRAIVSLGDKPHANPDSALNTMRSVHRRLLETSTALGRTIKAYLVDAVYQIPSYDQGDDHDLLGDDTDSASRKVPFARQAYREWHPMAGDLGPDQPLWQAFSFGRTVRVILPDLRTERSHKRAIDGPEKTMLGATQLALLLAEIATAPERWIVIGSSVPFNTTAKCSRDAWLGYQDEKSILLATGCTRCLVISGDLHSGGGCDTGVTSGWPECNTPRANRCGNQTGCLGTWSEGIDGSAVDGVPVHGFVKLTLTATEATFEVVRDTGVIPRRMVIQAPAVP